MAKTRQIFNSFNAGEWAPIMEGRSDLAKYHNACHEITNAICLKQGGVTRRPGTRFVAEVKTSAKKTRLIPFIFSTLQTYVIEIGEFYMRFYKNGARIESPPGTPVEISTSYLEGDLFDIHFTQSADVLYLVHKDHWPLTLSRISDTSWQLADLGHGDFGNIAGPWLPERTDNSFAPSATTGTGIAIVATSPFFTKGHLGALLRLKHATTWGFARITSVTDSLNVVANVFSAFAATTASVAFQEGSWALGTPTTSQYALTAAGNANGVYTGTIVATANSLIGLSVIISGFANPANNGTFIITANNGTTTITTTNLASVTESHSATAAVEPQTRGFPSAVTLFQQRLWLAASSGSPDTIWGSQSTDYESFDPGTGLDDQSITFTLASNKVNVIRWIAPSRALLAGSTGQEWQIGDPSIDTPITPGNPNAKPETTYGSSSVSPVQAHNVLIFVQGSGTRLREYSFNFQSDSYLAPDMTILAEHIAVGGIVQMDYQQEKNSVVWAIRADGALIGMTYERDQDVEAWHRHVTGAAQDFSDGKFESVAVIPNPTPTAEDQAWMIVNRTIGGVTKRYVEYMDTQSGFYQYLQVDAGLTYSGAATATLTGLNHLEGQTVDVLASGVVYPQKVVSGGQITGLSPMVTQAEVGLHFESTIVTMRPEAGGDAGTAQGGKKRFNQIIARLYNSSGVKINNQQLDFALFTGDKKLSNLGWDTDARITIKQQNPLPLTLLAIIGDLYVGDS